MDEREYVPVPHAVTAMLHLAGPQPTNITIQHPGTQEATITIAVRKCVIYLCTWAAADGVGQIWRRAATDALAFPRTVGTVQPSHRHAAPTNAAEPSVVVHTYGHPAGFVRLSREPGKTAYLHVQMGGLTFFFHDKLSFESVAGAFLRAAELGAQHLPRVDLRQARPVDRHAPSLAGHAAAGAREHLEGIAQHPTHVAAASLSELEDRIAASLGPLQAALASARASRDRAERTGAAEHDAREQPPASQELQQAAGRQIGDRAPVARRVPVEHAAPIRRPGRAGGPHGGEHPRRGGQTR
jgi:hypothetical protein